MHPPAHLPYVDLTDPQCQLLAQLVAGPLPEAGGEFGAAAEAAAARGLDPDQIHADVPPLVWLQLIERQDGLLAVTDLGTAVHYRSLYESSETVLSEIAQLAEAHEVFAPEFARAVRRLAQGAISFAEASAGLRSRPA